MPLVAALRVLAEKLREQVDRHATEADGLRVELRDSEAARIAAEREVAVAERAQAAVEG